MRKDGLVFLGTLFLIFACLYSCQEGNGEKARKAKEKQIQERFNVKREKIKSDLMRRYNAIFFPPKSFSEKRVFTYHLQKFLVSDSQTLILFSGTLEDIYKEGEQFVIQFSTSLLNSDQTLDLYLVLKDRVKFHLKCNYEDVQQLIEKPPDQTFLPILEKIGGRGFFVVCKITDVQKIVNYTTQGYATGQDEVELEIESPDVFNVMGELVEMVSY